MSRAFLLPLAVLMTVSASSAATAAEPERWALIGDSITNHGDYPRYLELFQVTRRPATAPLLINAGIYGDSVGGALRRLDWDVLAERPQTALVLLGMNDVGRGDYVAGCDDETTLRKRAASIAVYEKNLRELVDRLRAASVRVILLSSTPYDDTSALSSAPLPGCNDALAELGRRARAIAAEAGTGFIDLNRPLTTLNRTLQERDPAATIVGNDRVHLGAPGHLAVLHFLLQGLGERGDVALVHLDAASAALRRADFCAVDQLSISSDLIAFRYTAESLPFPVPPEAATALDWLPFQLLLNREELRVAGLPADSRWTLSIDGQTVATLESAQLAVGVNLADLPTPQRAQAESVIPLIRERWELTKRLRLLAALEYFEGKDLPRPITVESLEPALARWEEKLARDPGNWQREFPARYRLWKPKQEQIRAEADDLLRKAREAAAPRTRMVTLTRA